MPLIDWGDIGREVAQPPQRQPTFRDVSHRPARPAPAWYGGSGMFGGLTGGVSGPSLVDIIRANTQNPPPQQRQPTFQDVSHRPQSTRNLADLFRGLASVGIDPSRL